VIRLAGCSVVEVEDEKSYIRNEVSVVGPVDC
jgi:hypothetical protein